jgi:hypothetical protein
VFLRNPKIEEAPLQGELMLFNPESSQFYVLNATMALIWRRCETAQTAEGMIQKLTEEFEGVDAAMATHDVDRAVAELKDLGLLIDAPT